MKKNLFMISAWPEFKEAWNFEADENAVETIKAAVRAIRNVRAQMNVPPSKKAKVIVVTENNTVATFLRRAASSLQHLVMPVRLLYRPIKPGSARTPYLPSLRTLCLHAACDLSTLRKKLSVLKKKKHV